MKRLAVALSLGALLVAGILASALLGQLPVHPAEVVGGFLRAIGIPNPWQPQDEVIQSALQFVRFPRIVMAIVVGAALAAAGAVMQAIFGNPLAEPGVVGVSSGAAVAAAAVIVFDLATFGAWTVALAAFVGGLVTTFEIGRASCRERV